jgi:hypothetical protein
MIEHVVFASRLLGSLKYGQPLNVISVLLQFFANITCLLAVRVHDNFEQIIL